jgi:hypothetical protein
MSNVMALRKKRYFCHMAAIYLLRPLFVQKSSIHIFSPGHIFPDNVGLYSLFFPPQELFSTSLLRYDKFSAANIETSLSDQQRKIAGEVSFSFLRSTVLVQFTKEKGICAADFSLLNLPKGKSLGRSKPATNS